MGRQYRSNYRKYQPTYKFKRGHTDCDRCDRKEKEKKRPEQHVERIEVVHEQTPWIVRVEAKNAGQREMEKAFGKCDIMLTVGVAGTGKTHMALGLALQEVRSGAKECVYVIRPPVGATERGLGYTKGTLEEKLAPFALPVQMLVRKVAYNVPEGVVRVFSLEHSRGVTFENCVVLVDEAQNLTLKEFRLLISRLGENARMIFAGDPDQADIKETCTAWLTDLDYVVDCLMEKPGVAVVEFSDKEIIRHPRMHIWLKALANDGK